MGAGYNNLGRKKKKQQCKVGREEEGSSSNRPELAAFFRSAKKNAAKKIYIYVYIHIYIYSIILAKETYYVSLKYASVRRLSEKVKLPPPKHRARFQESFSKETYRVATISRLLKIIGLFCKTAL